MLREKPLHAGVKRWYAEDGDRFEVPVGGYVIDLVRGDLLIEVQTRGFSGMRAKLASLLGAGYGVRVVHPIAVDRWIVQVDDVGTLLARRRSPKHGALIDLVPELVSFPELLAHPRFAIEVLLTEEEELRRHDPARCWRRRGWTVVERRLVEVIDRVTLTDAADLRVLLPADLPDRFTTGRPRRAVATVRGRGAPARLLPPQGRDHRGHRQARPCRRVPARRHAGLTRREIGGAGFGSAELLGQRDDDALGAAEVAEPIAVLVLHHLADEFGAVGLQAGNDVVDVVDGEHDATHAQRVHRCVRLAR